MSTRVVVLLPVRNGADDLPGWFASIYHVADAVVALDDGSTDETAALLAAHPSVEVLLRNPRRDTYAGWDDAANRNRLLEAAGALAPDWVLQLDVDERIPADDAAALRAFLETDALPECAYGFSVHRMVDGDAFDRDDLIVYRLFGWQPGQQLPDSRLHLVPVPTSIPRSRWLPTTLRIQHLAGLTEARRRARYEKYREADPDAEFQARYEHLLEAPGPQRAFEARRADLPVLLDAGPRRGEASDELDLDAPVLSVIVIARDDEAVIGERVQAVVDQDCPEPFEVIVVTSGTDRTAAIAPERFPAVRVVTLDRPAFPGAARNAGLRVARGDIVSFPGSHVTLVPGSLAARVRAHQHGWAMVTGTTANGTPTRAGWAGYFLDNTTVLPGRAAGELRHPPAHCSYLRHSLDEVGGFPEHLRAGEDTVVNHELMARGHRAFRAPAAVLVHHNPCVTPGALVAHHFTRGRAFGRIVLDRNRHAGNLLRRERETLRRVARRRVRNIDGNVDLWGDGLDAEYRRTRPLVVAGALAAEAGTWFELLRPEPGKLATLWGRGTGGPLVFVHLPRTGGTSVIRSVEQWYGPDAVLRLYDADGRTVRDSLARLSNRKRRSVRAVVGHMAFGAGEYLPGARYVTFVRDPIERVISHYDFVRRHPRLPGHERALEGVDTLDDYVERSPYVPLVNNGMTRLLGGDLTRPGEPATDETLARACRRLDRRFVVVGVQERFDASMRRLADAFGWPESAPVHENASPGRPNRADLPAATVELIAERNTLDLALYEHAVARFWS